MFEKLQKKVMFLSDNLLLDFTYNREVIHGIIIILSILLLKIVIIVSFIYLFQFITSLFPQTQKPTRRLSLPPIFKGFFRKLISLPLRTLYFIYFPLELGLRRSLIEKRFHAHSKFYFYLWFRHIYRMNKIRFKNVKNAIYHSPASTFSIVISYASIIIGIALSFFIDPSSPSEKFSAIFIIIVTVIVLFLPLPIYLRYYILNLPLEQYSSLVKTSLNESEMISFISYKIWKLCNKFERETSWMEKMLIIGDTIHNNYLINEETNLRQEKKIKSGVLHKGKDPENQNDVDDKTLLTQLAKLHKSEEPSLTLLCNKINEWEIDLQRITVLIKTCSERLRIPEVEVCEHIFQFSPTMYWAWLRKFTDNLRVVSGLDTTNVIDNLEVPLYDIIRSSLYECHRFKNRNKRFLEYQCQNIAFSDLHTDIIEFATNRSTSEATKIYIRTISRIAISYDKYKENRIMNKNGLYNNLSKSKLLTKLLKSIFVKRETKQLGKDSLYDAENGLLNRFRYVHNKREAHVGIDLCYASSRILDKLIKALDGNSESKKKNRLEDLKEFFEGRNYENKKVIDSNIISLKLLYHDTIEYIHNARQVLRNNFCKEIVPFVESLKKDEHLFIFTFGYSKNTRDILKSSLPKTISSIWGNSDLGKEFPLKFKSYKDGKVVTKKIDDGKIVSEKIKVVIFQSEAESDIDSRMIKYLITEDKIKGFENVLVSNLNFIMPLIDETSKIIILLGAEAYDKKRRFTRTSSHKLLLNTLMKEVKGKYKKIKKDCEEHEKNCEKDKEGIQQAENYRKIASRADLNKNLKIYVVAESFKQHTNFMEITKHFGDQYDKIEMFEPYSNIISNEDSYLIESINNNVNKTSLTKPQDYNDEENLIF